MAQADFEPITADTFAAFATFLGTPLPDDPIRAIRILRREAAAEIERLITMLDALGGDPDLEDGHDDEEEPNEPSLGWTSTLNQASRNQFGDVFSNVDAEHEHDGREPEVDGEPSLGSRNAHTGFTLVGGGLIDLGGPIEEIRPGDVVWFEPNEKHWHGAAPNNAMTHIAIQEAQNGQVVEWMEHVSDEQYGA